MTQQLGAGRCEVTITEWAGRIVWQSTETTIGSVQWGRERCEVSKAVVEAIIPPHVMGVVDPWVHLLTVFRDGALVWHGVVVRTESTGRVGKIEAADGAVLFKRRRIPTNRTWRQHDATQVMRTMVEDACGYADPVGLVSGMATCKSRLWVTSQYVAAESMLQEAINDLVEVGLVWAVNAGRLLVGPVAAQHETALLQDQNFDGAMTVVKDGTETVTDCLVVGKGVWGAWSAGPTPVGLLQAIEKADGAVTAAECQQVAKRAVDDAYVPPRLLVVPDGSRLLPTAPVTIGELIPGVQIPVSTAQTGIRVASTMELESLAVKIDDSGESVEITLRETSVTGKVTSLPDPAELDWRSPWQKELEKNNYAKAKDDDDTVGIPPA